MDRRSGRGGAASLMGKAGVSGHTWLLKELQDRAKQPLHDHIFDFLKMKVSLCVCIERDRESLSHTQSLTLTLSLSLCLSIACVH
jgi:hypothetical protein